MRLHEVMCKLLWTYTGVTAWRHLKNMPLHGSAIAMEPLKMWANMLSVDALYRKELSTATSWSQSDMECNLHKYVEEKSTFMNVVKPPLAKELCCLVLPSKGSSWRTRCCAVLCGQSHQLSASEAFLLNLRGAPQEQQGLVPSLSIKGRTSSPLGGLRWGPLCVRHTGCSAAHLLWFLLCWQLLRGWAISKMEKKKVWIVLLLQIYFLQHLDGFGIVYPHYQSWELFSKMIVQKAFTLTETLWSLSKYSYFGILHKKISFFPWKFSLTL